MVLDGSLFEKEQGGHTFALNRMERQLHVAPFLGSHAACHVSKSKEVEVAAASGVRGRAPGLVSAFLAAPTEIESPSFLFLSPYVCLPT